MKYQINNLASLEYSFKCWFDEILGDAEKIEKLNDEIFQVVGDRDHSDANITEAADGKLMEILKQAENAKEFGEVKFERVMAGDRGWRRTVLVAGGKMTLWPVATDALHQRDVGLRYYQDSSDQYGVLVEKEILVSFLMSAMEKILAKINA